MLSLLQAEGLMLFGSLNIEVGPGLTVFTGETGAGKTLLLDTLSMVLGEKAKPELVAQKSSSLKISAVFDPPDIATDAMIENDLDDLPELLLSRHLEKEGRSKAFINNQIVSSQFLGDLGEVLIDYHGQHQHQTLMKPKYHRLYLDAYLGDSITKALTEYRSLRNRFVTYKKDLEVLQKNSSEEIRAAMAAKIQELEQVNLEALDEDALIEEKNTLRKADLLINECYSILRLLDDDNGALDGVRLISARIYKNTQNDRFFEELERISNNAVESLDSLRRELKERLSILEHSPGRLDEIESALFKLQELKRKYSRDKEGLIALAGELKTGLDQLQNLERSIDELQSKINLVKKNLNGAAENIEQIRKEGAHLLDNAVLSQVEDLNLKGSAFHTGIERKDGEAPPDPHEIRFFFSGNKGMQMKPLEDAASGGEISRLMLALKIAMQGSDPVPTLIFDEIDAGIGGLTAVKVGQKLKELSEKKQILCITHLPQIASFADRHYVLEKRHDNGSAITTVKEVIGEERLNEIARMISGDESQAVSVDQARELIKKASVK